MTISIYPVDRTVLIARLQAARSAYHDIMLGGAVKTVVDQNGERIEYTAASSARLQAYIFELERQLGGTPSAPMTIWMA